MEKFYAVIENGKTMKDNKGNIIVVDSKLADKIRLYRPDLKIKFFCMGEKRKG